MTYLLWTLLNIGLFVFFIITCLRATRLIREKYGLFSSIILVIGVLSFIGLSGYDNDKDVPNSNQVKTWQFASEDSLIRNETFGVNMDLESTWISKYHLGISYGKTRQGMVNIPISAYSWSTGFICGTDWKPVSIIVNRTNDNRKFEYFVNGVVEWKLLGATTYSQLKTYKGVALIK